MFYYCLFIFFLFLFFFFFKQKTAYEMRISDWSSDVCSSDLAFFRSALVCGGWQQRVDQHRLAVLRHTIFGIVHTDPRLPGEGHGQCGGAGAVLVDPAGAGIEPLCKRQPAIDVPRPDGAAATVGTAIRLCGPRRRSEARRE